MVPRLGLLLRILKIWLLTLLWSSALPAQEKSTSSADLDIRPSEVIHWHPSYATTYEDGYVLVAVTLETERDFALYTDKITFQSSSGLRLENIKTPQPETIIDPLTEQTIEAFRGGEFFLLFNGLEAYKEANFTLTISSQGCAQKICLFPYEENLIIPTSPGSGGVPFELFPKVMELSKTPGARAEAEVGNEEFEEEAAGSALGNENLSPESKGGDEDEKLSEEAIIAEPESGIEDRLADHLRGELPLLLILLIAFLGGLLTNLTPCVYPMIPITIRLLSRLGRKPLPAACSYSLGIVLSYTSLGIVAAFSGSLFGGLMANPWVNLFFALIMSLLAITMLGYGNFAFLQQVGNHFGDKSNKLRKAFLMGMGAGLVASPCTGPILATMLSLIASSSMGPLGSALMIFCYSLGFALPYVALGGLSAKLASAKVSPAIQNAVKLGFSAIMFYLSCYYLRIPLYRYFAAAAPYWQSLALGSLVAGLFISSLVLLRSWRQQAKGLLILPSLLLGLGFFAALQWRQASSSSHQEQHTQLKWFDNEEAAFAEARKTNKPVLIDFWAEWCEACKHMDTTTFADPKVQEKLKEKSWVLLRLDLSESTDHNEEIQQRFHVAGLPTLLLMPANGDLKHSVGWPGYVSAGAFLTKVAAEL